ncbi:MAG: TIGR02597 family protein [Verrucomicrobiae bacterium]
MKLFIAILLATAAAAAGQVATSNPLGLVTYRFPATASSATQYISIPLTSEPIYSGPLASSTSNATTNTLTFEGAPFTSLNLAQAGSPYFALILSGQQAGRSMLIKGNTANSLTVDITDNTIKSTPLNTASFSVAAADQVQVFPGDTLASFFGSTPAGLSIVAGGATSTAADTVSIYNRSTAKFDQYFFNTTGGVNRWQRVGGSTLISSNGVVLYPEAVVCIQRQAGRVESLGGVTGCVPTTQPLTKVLANVGFYTGTRLPVNLTLGQLNTISPWTPTPTIGTADVLSLFNAGTGRWVSYYLYGANWVQSSTGPSQNSVMIPAGAPVLLLKRSNAPIPYPHIPNLPYAL